MRPVRSCCPIGVGLPRFSGGSASALPVSGPAQRSLTLRPARSPSRHATLFTEGSDGFVTSTVASIATGRSEPVPGWDLHPLWTSAFSRRTEKSGLDPDPEHYEVFTGAAAIRKTTAHIDTLASHVLMAAIEQALEPGDEMRLSEILTTPESR